MYKIIYLKTQFVIILMYKCEICDKTYKSRMGFYKHNKKHHPEKINKGPNLTCAFCKKEFKHYPNKWTHEQKCKLKCEKIINTHLEFSNKTKQNDSSNIKNIAPSDIKNIKSKLDQIFQKLENNPNANINTDSIEPIKPKQITNDNHVDVIELTKISNSKIKEWIELNSTKQYINTIKTDSSDFLPTQINSNGNILLNSHLIHMFINWFYLQVLVQANDLYNPITLCEQIKVQNEKIKKLENTILKKQKRTQYTDNAIYIVTTTASQAESIYIVGKAEKLADRLSVYNKTAEHTVVYYKQCPDKNTMGIVESMVLNKLEPYRERANRDRFCLPVNQPISLFTNIIDECVGFFTCIQQPEEIVCTIKTNPVVKTNLKSQVEIEV